MNNIVSTVTESLLQAASPLWNLAAVTCRTNGQIVDCPESLDSVLAGAGFGFVLLFVVIVAFIIVVMWKVYAKAGKPGWASIIPIYNSIVMLEIVGKPIWWIFLLFIPIVNIVIGIIMALELAKAFGKGIGFGIGLVFLPPIFYAILAFDSSEYNPPSSQAQTPSSPTAPSTPPAPFTPAPTA